MGIEFKADLGNYNIELYQNWNGVPEDDLENVRSLLEEVNFVKAPIKGRIVMEDAVQFYLEKRWAEYNKKASDRTNAPVVILPNQENLAFALADFGIEKRYVIDLRNFDQAESVVEGMTAEKLDSNQSGSVYIVGRIQGPNDLLNLMQASQRLRELGYKELNLVTSCLGWTRQDRPDEEKGQPNTTAVVVKVVSGLVDRFAVLKPHSNETARNLLKSEIPHVAFSAWRYLIDGLFRDRNGIFTKDQKVIIVGPDIGAYGESGLAARYLSKILSEKHKVNIKVEMVSLDKDRDTQTGKINFLPLEEEKRKKLQDAIVIALDDTIATAETTLKMMGLVLNIPVEDQQKMNPNWIGAKKVILLSTHASLQEEAIKRLSHKGFMEVRFTDSRDFFKQPPTDGNMRVVSCMPLIARFIRADRELEFNPWQDNYFRDIVC